MSLLFGTVTVSAATISTSMNSEKNTITASAKAGAGSYSFTCKGWEKHPTTNHEVEYNKVIGAGGEYEMFKDTFDYHIGYDCYYFFWMCKENR